MSEIKECDYYDEDGHCRLSFDSDCEGTSCIGKQLKTENENLRETLKHALGYYLQRSK